MGLGGGGLGTTACARAASSASRAAKRGAIVPRVATGANEVAVAGGGPTAGGGGNGAEGGLGRAGGSGIGRVAGVKPV